MQLVPSLRLFRVAFFAFGVATLPGLLGCSSGEEVTKPVDGKTDGASEGTVAVYTATLFEGTNETQYFLRKGNDEQRLWFDEDPQLSPGSHVRVWGDVLADGSLRVSRFEQQAAFGTATEALVTGTSYAPRKFALVRVDIGGGINLSVDEAKKRLFGTNSGDNSVKQYYVEASYGTQDISGDVLGPFSYQMIGCNTRGLATTLKQQIGQYDHYLWYMGSRTAACNWSGLAESGTPTAPTNDTWYNGSAGCVVLVQEPGHNFGMMHSSSMTCGGATFADNPGTSCTHVEYGDTYDPMGGGCYHMNAWQKVYEGWLQKCNGVKASNGTYTLKPIEDACDGIQVLQIPMPKVRPFTRSGGGGTSTTENLQYYYLELRTKQGFDSGLSQAPTVLVHVAEDFRKRGDRGRHTWLLDMNPSTTRTIEGLGAGQGYQDPAGGVRFDVVSVDANSATIKVQGSSATAATCLDGSTLDTSVEPACSGVATVGGGTGTGGAGGGGGVGGAGGATTIGPRVEAFTLVDTDANSDIVIVEDGDTLDLDKLPPNLTMRVDTDPAVVGSVVFVLDGAPFRTENTEPYTLSADDAQGTFGPWSLAMGTHTVTATPYTGSNGSGTAGAALTITFTLARGVIVAPTPDAGAHGSGGFGGFGGTSGSGGSLPSSGGFVSAGGAPVQAPLLASGGAMGSGGFPSGFAGAGFGFAGAGGSHGGQDGGCTCRVAGDPNRAGAALAYPAIGLAVSALALRRSRRRR